jgi:hypothetical protein
VLGGDQALILEEGELHFNAASEADEFPATPCFGSDAMNGPQRRTHNNYFAPPLAWGASQTLDSAASFSDFLGNETLHGRKIDHPLRPSVGCRVRALLAAVSKVKGRRGPRAFRVGGQESREGIGLFSLLSLAGRKAGHPL